MPGTPATSGQKVESICHGRPALRQIDSTFGYLVDQLPHWTGVSHPIRALPQPVSLSQPEPTFSVVTAPLNVRSV